jgi:hypothetical protein
MDHFNVGPMQWPYVCGCGLGDVCHHHTGMKWMSEEPDHLYDVFFVFLNGSYV